MKSKLIDPVKFKKSNFQCIDALNFKQYREFDVIYFYQPISDYDLMTQLVRRIVKQMKSGAYLSVNFGTDAVEKSSMDFMKKSKDIKFVSLSPKSRNRRYFNLLEKIS